MDGPNNTVFIVDAVPSEEQVGSPQNYYGNGFYARKTKLATTGTSGTDYNGATSRSWDISNTSKLHPYSGKPATYKLVSREVAPLLPKEGSLVWKRAAFARHAVFVTKCECRQIRDLRYGIDEKIDRDDQLWPAGRHVPQTSGDKSAGLDSWIGDGTESIDDTDIVLWHTFGLTHFPAPEDFPIMPAEPLTLLLRPRNFFSNNPVMDVPPSYCITPSQVANQGVGAMDTTDQASKLASPEGCCESQQRTKRVPELLRSNL